MKSRNIARSSLLTGFVLTTLAFSTSVIAHQVNGPDGKPTHEHVYKRSTYGSGVVVGHYAQPAGSRGIVIWQGAPNRGYGKAQPGFIIPQGNTPQPSQKQMFQQKPTFTRDQRQIPGFNKK